MTTRLSAYGTSLGRRSSAAPAIHNPRTRTAQHPQRTTSAPHRGATSKPGVCSAPQDTRRPTTRDAQQTRNAQHPHRTAVQPQSLGSRSAPQDMRRPTTRDATNTQRTTSAPHRGATSKPGVVQRTPGHATRHNTHCKLQIAKGKRSAKCRRRTVWDHHGEAPILFVSRRQFAFCNVNFAICNGRQSQSQSHQRTPGLAAAARFAANPPSR